MDPGWNPDTTRGIGISFLLQKVTVTVRTCWMYQDRLATFQTVLLVNVVGVFRVRSFPGCRLYSLAMNFAMNFAIYKSIHSTFQRSPRLRASTSARWRGVTEIF